MLTSELVKLLRKPRTYLGPAAMTGLIVIVLIALKYGNEFRYMEERLARDFIISGSFVNAAFMARFMLLEFVVYMFLPLFACTVCGDVLASEASDGTIRTLLCRPVTRLSVVASKYLAGSLYALVLTFGTGALAYLVGTIFLGRGSLLSFNDGLWVLPERMAVQRLLLGYGLIALGMVAAGSIAFLISTFVSHSNGAIGGAMGLLIGSSIIGQIEYFAWLKPYLLSTYLQVGHVFTDQPDTQLVATSALVMLAYSAASFAVGLVIFHRRDILS